MPLILTAVAAVAVLGYLWHIGFTPGFWLDILLPLAAVALWLRLWLTRRTHPHLETARVRYGTRSKSAGVAQRWGNRAERKQGVATALDILRRSSALLMWWRGPVVRPSLRGVPAVKRVRVRPSAVAVRIARVGLLTVWSSLEDVTITFGGPRTGKTAWLCARILDFPGFLVVTSTRGDVHEATATLRRRWRGPTFVFNPSGMGELELTSTISFDPLTGCMDPTAAADRASDMVGATSSGGGGDRAHWEGQARRVLAALMHAAALGDLGMRDVLRWVADPDVNKAEILRLLRRSPAESMLPAVQQFIDTNEKTRSSITSGIMPALEWLNSPTAAEAGSADLWPFDVEDLIASRATVYMLGSEEAHTAPLVAALTGFIAREGRRIAAEMPGGRLDPPMGLYLDEAANVSPVPLHKWSSYFGGSGITILAAFQSRAQLLERWGKPAAAIILNNAGAVMLFGGTKDPEDLGFWAELSGHRTTRMPNYDDEGRVKGYGTQRVPVFSSPQLSNLPPWRVVIYRKAMLPCIGKVRPVWRRWDVKYADTYPGERALLAVAVAVGWVVRKVRKPVTPTPTPNPATTGQPQPAGRP